MDLPVHRLGLPVSDMLAAVAVVEDSPVQNLQKRWAEALAAAADNRGGAAVRAVAVDAFFAILQAGKRLAEADLLPPEDSAAEPVQCTTEETTLLCLDRNPTTMLPLDLVSLRSVLQLGRTIGIVLDPPERDAWRHIARAAL